MTTDTWEEVGALSTSRSALASAVVRFNRLDEEVRESLRWHREQEEVEMETNMVDYVDFNLNYEMEDDKSDIEESDDDMIFELMFFH